MAVLAQQLEEEPPTENGIFFSPKDNFCLYTHHAEKGGHFKLVTSVLTMYFVLWYFSIERFVALN